MATGITIRSFLVKLGFDADTSDGEKFEDQMTSVEEGLGNLADKAKGFAIAFGASVAAAFGVAAVKEFLAEQEEAVLQIEKRRGAIAATADEMQRLGFIARESGFEMDELSDAIADLAEKTTDAELTGAGYKENLDRLGISARDLSGEMKDPIALFLEFSDAIAKLEDGGEKTFIAMELMGDAGKNMVPLLNKGSEGIKEMMLAADAAGFIMTDSTIAATLEYSEASRRLTDAIVLLKSTALDKLLPIITAITKRITAWLMDTDNITAALLRLRQAAIVTGSALAAMAVGRVARAFTQLPAILVTVTNSMKALRAAIFSVNVAMVAFPLAIAAILLAGQDLFSWISGGDSLIGRFVDQWAETDGILGTVARTIQNLRPMIEQFFSAMIPVISKLLPKLTDLATKLAQAFAKAFAPAVIKFALAMVDVFTEMAPLLADVADQIGGVVSKALVMGAKIMAILTTTLIPVIRSILPLIVSSINGIINAITTILPFVEFNISLIAFAIRKIIPIVTAIVSFVSGALLTLTSFVSGLIADVSALVGPLINGFIEGIIGAVDIIGGALGVLVGWFQTAFDAIAAIIKPVSDSIASVIKGVQAVTGGASVLQTVARAAPSGAAGQASRAIGGASNRSSSLSVGAVNLSLSGSTNMGPAEVSRSANRGLTEALLAAQLRAAAKEVA